MGCYWTDRNCSSPLNRYDGDWKNGKKHGKGTETWVNGEKYSGDWKVRYKYETFVDVSASLALCLGGKETWKRSSHARQWRPLYRV